MDLNSWAGLCSQARHAHQPNDRFDATTTLARSGVGGAIHAAGRSYSDVALPLDGGDATLTCKMRHIVSFDREKGVMEVESGVNLGEIQSLALEAGWGLAVLPGTALATAGGAFANDVHGKNHIKRGAFSRTVIKVCMMRSDRGVFDLDRSEPALWHATVGGLGATGLILTLTLQLVRWGSSQVLYAQTRFVGLSDFLLLARGLDDEYVVGWVDTFSNPVRGVVFHGSVFGDGAIIEANGHGRLSSISMPNAPLINAWMTRGFNKAYWWSHSDARGKLAQWPSFFCPLDKLKNWNRLYGKAGFSQFQCVIPEAQAVAAYEEIFQRCRHAGQGSFLSVIKRFGSISSEGALSFSRAGVTFAMDFPNAPISTALLTSLSHVAMKAGGALYPAKMNVQCMDDFERSFPDWASWRLHWDKPMGACATPWLRRLGLS